MISGGICPNCAARSAQNNILDINFTVNDNYEIITTVNTYCNDKQKIYEVAAKLLYLISVGAMSQRCFDTIKEIPNVEHKEAILELYSKYIEHHYFAEDGEDEPLVSPINVFKEEQI